MKKDDYVKIVSTDGNYRYGYIQKISDRGTILVIDLFDEGESKIAYDEAYNEIVGVESVDYVSLLTEIEKKIVPLLAVGCDTNEIATAMSISPTTVRAHLRNMKIKLRLDDRAQLVAFSLALSKMIEQTDD